MGDMATLSALQIQVNDLLNADKIKAAMACLEGARAQFESTTLFFQYEMIYGVVLARLKRFPETLAVFARLAEARPHDANILRFHAQALQELHRYQEGLEVIDRCLALEPELFEGLRCKALLLDGMGYDREAIEFYDRLIASDTSDTQSRFNRSLHYLRLGDYRRGFLEYEYRWSTEQLRLNPAGPIRRQLLEQGMEHLDAEKTPPSALAGKELYVYNEQGNGDYIHFARYLLRLKQLGARIHIGIYGGYLGLYNYYRHWHILDSVNIDLLAVQRSWTPVAICSLALYFRCFSEAEVTLPAAPPPLHHQRHKIADWLGNSDPQRPRIGLTVSGAAGYGGDHKRTISLDLFTPILAHAADFFLIQTEVREADQPVLERHKNLRLAAPCLSDFGDTSALLQEMDLVISVDTSVAHLAGSHQLRVWNLIHFVPDWRWGLEKDYTPWYPTMKLFRRLRTEGDWQATLERVEREFSQFLTFWREQSQTPLPSQG